MADSFFGSDTSLSNVNDDEGGGGPSEDEYDALNDETFGGTSEDFDWEEEHEQLAQITETSRRNTTHENLDVEASLSQLVLDENEGQSSRPQPGSSTWAMPPFPIAQQTMPAMKNVCTVEELERRLRQNLQPNVNQTFFQPRFPVILQRPPGLTGPVSMPFPQNHGLQQMNPNQQSLNQFLNQGQMGPMNNQMGPPNSQMGHPNNQMGPNQMNIMPNHMVQQNHLMQPNQNMGMNQMQTNMGQNHIPSNQMVPNNMGNNQIGPNHNQLGQNQNQMLPNMGNNIGPNQMGQNHGLPNGNQFGGGMMPQHMMGQPRMIAPPPGMGNIAPRPNFNPSMGQFNQNFHTSAIQKPDQQQLNQQQQNMLLMKQQQPILNQNQQMLNQQIAMNNLNQYPNKQQQQQQQQKPQKPQQKNRVFNNSNQKNLSSQNLVQLIQNTHPMLQFNNIFNNANHHPMLNNRNNMINQFPNNHPMFNNQRNSDNFSNNNRFMNGDDLNSSSEDQNDSDEYAGLMSAREKQWLINIQMLQLNTGAPYVDDFYYTVFLDRQSRKEKEGIKEAHKANQQNHPLYSGGKINENNRERHNSGRHNSTSEEMPTPRTYVPTQFENSLGKLQCGSVTAPRKIIDVDLVQSESQVLNQGRQSRAPSRASTTNPLEVPREIRRTKQLLLDIEALYNLLITLEELSEPLAISNALILKERDERLKASEAAKESAAGEGSDVLLRTIGGTPDKRQVVSLTSGSSGQTPVKNLLDEDKDELINKIFSGLLHEDRLQQFMTVRKGKTLIGRFLARVPASHQRLRSLWSRVLRALPSTARRDARDDRVLPSFAPYFHKYISSATGWAPVLEACALLSEALDPARTPHALSTSFTLTAICSLVEKAITLTNTPEPTSNERQWTKFLKTVTRTLKNKPNIPIARPMQPLAENKLYYHLKLLESRSSVQILQRGRSTAEFADLTNSDLSELLISHLC